MLTSQLCSNPHCKRTSPGDGPTCRWHVRNYGTEDEPKHVTLCNACKINFDQGKYCPFCVQIYREKDPDSFDGKEWVGCDNRHCRRWVHVDCEITSGNIVDPRAYYNCPSCRKENTTTEICDRKRPGRPPAAQEQVATNVPNSDSTPMEVEAAAKPRVPVTSRNSRRPLQVDLSKLETSSLKRYRRVYNLRDVTSGCKEELIPVVARHFAAQVVEENDTLLALAYFLKKQENFASSIAPHRIPRTAAK